jgi:hypothetical protein
MQTKTCSHCKLKKTIDEFHRSSVYKDGYRGQCIECRRIKDREYYARPVGQRRVRPIGGRTGPDRKRAVRNFQLKRKFGITIDQFDEMSAAQDHKCAICLFPALRMPHKVLHVDHCHTTGVVRGLLCNRCNTMLGHMGDNVAGAMKVLQYVSKGA